MRIMNQKVEHKRYGIGTIFALKGKKVYVAFGKLYGDMAFPYPKVFEPGAAGRADGGTCIKAAVENQRQQRDAYNEMPVTAGKGVSGGRIRTGHALCRGQCFWEAPFCM